MAKTESKEVATKPTADQQVLAIKKETADLVLEKVQAFQEGGELHLPANYSAPNALKSAWLHLQNVVDKNKNPVLATCSKASIANTMLDMVIQGLNPAKKQCYFIAYGKELTLMRSYLGTVAVCLRLSPNIADIFAEVVYEGDHLEYSIVRGRRIIEAHTQQLENINDDNIIAAYAIALGQDDQVLRSELMTMDQILQSWRQSKVNPVDDKGRVKAGTPHDNFPGEMCKRTVVNRMSKHIIGESDDADLVLESVARTDEAAIKAAAQKEIEENANQGDVIDIKSEPKKEKPKPAPAAKKAEPKKKTIHHPEKEEKIEVEIHPPLTEAEKAEILAEEMNMKDPGF